MAIVWDGYGTENPMSGIGVYAQALKNELANLGVFPEYISGDEFSLPFFGNKFFTKSKMVYPFQQAFILRAALNSKRFYEKKIIYHGLSNFNLPWGKCSSKAKLCFVLTVHDLIPLVFPKLVSLKSQAELRIALPKALEKADSIICVSQWCKESIVQRYPNVGDKIKKIANGSPTWKNFSATNDDSNILHSNQPIKILTVARDEPYKQLDVIVKILEAAKGRLAAKIVTDARGVKRLGSVVKQHKNLDPRMLALETNLSDIELAKRYQWAHVYVQPSIAEGFCLPLVEASSYGLPRLFISGSGMDEHHSVLTCESLKSHREQMSEWIDRIEDLYARRCQAGWHEIAKEEHAKLNTWKECARAVKYIYDDLISD